MGFQSGLIKGIFTVDLDSDQSEVLVLELFTSDGKSVISPSVYGEIWPQKE